MLLALKLINKFYNSQRKICFVFLPQNLLNMKKKLILCSFLLLMLAPAASIKAQCSICTKTASQLGEKQGLGLNSGIVYLMLTPFAVGGYIGYRWWKNEKALRNSER